MLLPVIPQPRSNSRTHEINKQEGQGGGEYMEDAPEALRSLKKYKEPLQHAIIEWLFLKSTSLQNNKPRVPIAVARRTQGQGIGIEQQETQEKPNSHG